MGTGTAGWGRWSTMMLTLSILGLAGMAASIRANLGFGGGAYVMVAELVIISAGTVLALAWLNPRLKRRALQRLGK